MDYKNAISYKSEKVLEKIDKVKQGTPRILQESKTYICVFLFSLCNTVTHFNKWASTIYIELHLNQ